MSNKISKGKKDSYERVGPKEQDELLDVLVVFVTVYTLSRETILDLPV